MIKNTATKTSTATKRKQPSKKEKKLDQGKKTNFRKEVKACVNCRKNHKKCDGSFPCWLCIRNKVECVANHKRKNVGRPKKEDLAISTTTTNTTSTTESVEIKKEMIQCNSCLTTCKQEINSLYCNQCGSRLLLSVNGKNNNECNQILPYQSESQLMNQMSHLQRQNLQLTGLVQLKMNSDQLWFFKKVIPVNGTIPYPLPSYIIEFSLGLQNLLGYNNLADQYYPSLLPKDHNQIIDHNLPLKLEQTKGIVSPKLTYSDNLFIKHAQGHYIHLIVNATLYFDKTTKNPTFRMVNVEKICDINVSESDLEKKPQHTIYNTTFHSDNFEELPEMIKKISPFRLPNKSNNDIQRDQSFISTIGVPNQFLPNQLSFDNLSLSQSLQIQPITNNFFFPGDDDRYFLESTYDNLFSFY